MINAIQIALSGLNAASRRAEASASNIANLTTIGSLDPAAGSPPYQALTTAQTAISGQNGETLGVRADIIPSSRPFVPSYSPDSPFADSNGLVGAPNVDLAEETVNLQLAKTTYQANIKTIETVNHMEDALLDIFDHKI
jgi:flagellar basal-body rod protein FlgC